MSSNDQSLKALWQKLPSETVVFTNAQMHSRAVKFQAKIKRQTLNEFIGFALLFALVGYMLSQHQDWQMGVTAALMIVGAIFVMWSFHKRVGIKSAVPPLSSGDSLLGFMRHELSRQRDATATVWRWYILPFMPAMLFIFIFRWMEEGETLTQITDMRIMIALTFAFAFTFFGAFVLWNFLAAARYQRELDGLDRYVRK